MGRTTQQAPPDGGARTSSRVRGPGGKHFYSRQGGALPLSVRDDRPRRPQDQATSHVYVIGSPGSTVVKLGTTTQLTKRLRALQLSSPVSLEVLWSAPGDRDDEAALHQHFSAFRQHGEWFDFGSEDPVAAVRLAFAAGLPVQRAGETQPRLPATPPVPENSLCTCGHELSFHHGRPRACTVAGWDEWLDCPCGQFVLGVSR
ncbi:GIY-YIG nuclease family protein [Streptomyces fungicidicus]|uniref:GIY-YIG nuclease family protein n=1 Tax=Streptomyces fungicidicus TaxID=68203 RepID=UPI0037F8481C